MALRAAANNSTLGILILLGTIFILAKTSRQEKSHFFVYIVHRPQNMPCSNWHRPFQVSAYLNLQHPLDYAPLKFNFAQFTSSYLSTSA